MDLAQVGVLRRRCRCTVAGLLLQLLATTLPAAAVDVGVPVAVVAGVDEGVVAGFKVASLAELSSITDSLTVSRAGCNLLVGADVVVELWVGAGASGGGGPVGPPWV